jgi:hypothetical protein
MANLDDGDERQQTHNVHLIVAGKTLDDGYTLPTTTVLGKQMHVDIISAARPSVLKRCSCVWVLEVASAAARSYAGHGGRHRLHGV